MSGEPGVNGTGKDAVQAVVLALRILEHVAKDSRPVGVTALARALGTTKSRIHRHLKTLEHEGYIVQLSDSDRYQLGTRLIALGRIAGDAFDLAGVASGILRELRDSLGHFSVVSEVESDGVRVLATMPGKSSVEIGVKRGSLLSFHGSAQGKIALAFGDEGMRASVCRSRLELLTPHTMVSPSILRKELERVRERGWAVAPNEALIGVNALAAPVFGPDGSLIGTLSIVDSIQFIEEEPTAEQIERVLDAARQISARLGYGRASRPAEMVDRRPSETQSISTAGRRSVERDT